MASGSGSGIALKDSLNRIGLQTRTAKTKCRKFETNIPRKGISGPSPNFNIHVPVSELYIPTMGRPVLLEDIQYVD
jgi:hypothetical protein